jgi:predicted AAA+ superfamily ATPase
MIFNRDIEGRIRHLAETFPAVVLTGARQVGKTTLLRRLFPSHTYVSLDLPSEAQLAELFEPLA